MGSNKKVTSTIFTNADIGTLTLTQILKSLSDPTCLEIVSTLFKENQECSCEIFSDLGSGWWKLHIFRVLIQETV